MVTRRSFLRSFACAIIGCAAAFAFGVALAADSTLQNCVQQVNPVPLAQLSGASQVRSSQDIGNVTVMELDGNYDRGVDAPRQEVAATFFAMHPDQYDFLVVFTTFEFSTGEALAFYNDIRNDTAGIGQTVHDASAAYGSAGKLQGYVDMSAMSRYSFVPDSAGYQSTLGTLAHEIMHRWAAHVHFIDANGADSTDLLGQENAHWSYFLDTDASLMYGSDWQAQADGKFHSVDTRHRYGPLDLYLAGFAAPSEVAPFTLIRNGDGGVATDYPVLGAVSGGHAEQVTIDQVIAASGARVPAAADAQKDFAGAVILLKRPGENVSAETLLELERFRVRFEQQFVQMTDGRGVVRLYTKARDGASAGLPQILHGSGATATPSGVAGAIAWLEARQQADGHWEDRPATAMRDTVATVRTLGELDAGFAGLAAARGWILMHEVANQDQRAWKLIGANGNEDATALSAAQGGAGGFAIEPGWASNPFDTSLIAAALAGHDPNVPALATALQFVGAQQNDDGSYGFTNGGRGRVLPTLRAASLLASAAGSSQQALLQRAADWIATRQSDDGGIGSSTSSSLVDTVETYSVMGRLPLAGPVITGARSYVRQNQQIDGDWGGSIYLTATGALAYAHDQRANLALATPPVATPAQPLDGEQVRLNAVVVNTGNVPAAATIARWYDGDPDLGGLQIGADIAVPTLAAGSTTSIAQTWDSAGHAGAHALWIVLDADATLPESSEQDNRGSIAVSVQPPSDAPDIVLSASDFSLDPASISALPSHVSVVGRVRNIGAQATSGVVIRLYAKPDLAHALAQTTLDVPARGSAPLVLGFDVTAPATVNLLLRADPDNVIAEANENNNDANLTLPYGQSLDLEVTPADLAMVGTMPLVGQDVNFDVTLHNRGTIDSPPAVLQAQIVQSGVSSTIFDAPVQIAAGQSVQRRVTWRANQPGAAQLRIAFDPANQVVETNEDNNNAQLDFNVAAPDQAELTFVSGSLQFLPTPGLQGQPLIASLGVRNLSSLATGSFRVALYTADPRSGAAAIGSTTVPALAGSSDATVTINVTDLGVSGDQVMYAMVDADNAIAELDETNNVIVAPLRVTSLPDPSISVADVSLTPALPVPGQPVEARVTVRNLGGQDAHDVAVRFLEGDVATGVAAGADQTIAVLASGASTTLTWNWTLGIAPNANVVTAIVDPDNHVREGSEDNNLASLPFNVQDSDFFSSERYISPNGDGIQDATAVVFRMPEAGVVEVDVVNGAQYTVRHFAGVMLNGDLRGQVIWDGRDDRGRIVPDGDYRVVAIGIGQQSHGGALVSVDNNRSSVLEAVDTPYGVYGNLPWYMRDTQIPPLASPLRDELFGFWQPNSATAAGLNRTSTLFPDTVPVISGRWVEAFRVANHLTSANLGSFAFSPDGRSLFALLTGATSGATSTFVLKTAVEDTDAPVLLATLGSLTSPGVLGFFDQDTLVVGPTAHGMLQTVDVGSGTVTPLRSFSAAQSYQTTQVVPAGVLLIGGDNGNGLQTFVPRDLTHEVVQFPSIAPAQQDWDTDYTYAAQLSPQQSVVAVYERDATQEKIDYVDLATGHRSTLLVDQSTVATDPSGVAHSVARYGMGWMERQNELLVQDAKTRTVEIFSANGVRLSQTAFPPLQRVGGYVGGADSGNGGYGFTSADAFPYVPDDLLNSDCNDKAGDAQLGIERHIYDPTSNRYFLGFGESIARWYMPSRANTQSSNLTSYALDLLPGIRDYYSADVDAGITEAVQQGTLTPLSVEADALQHPLRENCVDAPPPNWPALILGDGARITLDGHVQTLSRGVLPKKWPESGYKIQELWPDETRALLNTRAFSSLLNLGTVLRARTQGRGIELSGVAADRNFAYYRLDWAPIEQPNNWQALTPASSDQVFVDEFLTWVPPQTGTFVIRLTVVDRAGNSASTMATASSFDSSAIDSFSLDPRYFSPNGDGVKDQLAVKYRVRQAVTLAVRIKDANGSVVRSADLTYGAADVGPHEFDWDGRNDNGQVMPDGRYRVDVDGFAAWVVIDTVVPELAGDVMQAYQALGTTPKYVSVAPAVRYAMRDPNLADVALESSPIGENIWTLLSSPRGSLGSAQSISNTANWSDYAVAVDAFAHRSFRLRATDFAGNTHTLALGDAEEELPLQGVAGSPDGPSRFAFNYQPAPFTQTPDTSVLTPRPVEHDADDRLVAWDASGLFSSIAVETALADTPDQWIERGNYSLADVDCAHIECGPGSAAGELRLPLDVDALPTGARAFVRVRGEHADGSRVYSNQGYIRIGGLDAPTCGAPIPGSTDLAFSATEYYDGPLSSALLHYTGADKVEHTVDASSILDDRAIFTLPSTLQGATGWAVGIDSQGYSHRSLNSALRPCQSPPPGGGGPLWEVKLIRAPVVRDQCDGKPSDQIKFGFSIARPLHGAGEPLPSHIHLSYIDGISNQPVVLLDADVNEGNALSIGQSFILATSQWPEGEYAGRLDMTYPGGAVSQKLIELPIVKQPPRITITAPADGQRVCALKSSETLQSLPMSGQVDSAGASSYRLEIGAGAHPLGFDCRTTRGETPRPDQPDADCPPYEGLTDINGTSVAGDLGAIISRNLDIYNGISTVRLKGLNWSGGTVCTTSTIYLDSDVEFTERMSPRSPLALMGLDTVGIAPNGAAQYAQGQFFLRANEPIRFAATLHRATRDATSGKLVLQDEVLATLLQGDALQGDIDLTWDGRVNGVVVPDGLYGIAATASDGCSHSKTITYGALVDATPPAVALTAPAPGTTTAASVIEIAGSVTDASLSSWSLDVALPTSPNAWQNLAGGESPVPVAALLKAWSRGSIIGLVDLRLSAIDAFGNRSEVHVPVTLQDPPKLIGAAELQPPLFSPNTDGTLDSTRLQLGLLRNANLDVHVVNAANATVASIYAGAAPAGSSGFVWNGAGSAGAVMPDGDYGIVIGAQDPNGMAAPESLTLSVTVDTTPPTVNVLQPAGAFAGAGSAASLHFDDLHFASWQASLIRVADGVAIVSANGTQGGDFMLKSLADVGEGDYALHAVARDAAGNVTTRDSTFTLDATAPIVTLLTPAEGALIASSKPTSVTGSIADSHLASYTLSVAPETGDAWSDLAHGSANFPTGEILAWTPNLPDGRYRLRLRGVDEAGNTTDVVHVVDVDGTPPVAHISAPQDGAFVRSQIEIDGTATDAHLAGYRISLIRAADVATGNWSDVYAGLSPVDAGTLAALTLNLPEDDYLLRLTATDRVGLSSTDQVHVRIDTQPPPAPIGLIGHVDNHRDSVLDWNAVTASDLAGYVVYRGGEKITSTPVATIHFVDANAPEGRLQYLVRAVDRAGNESGSSNVVTLLVDHTPPAVSLSRPIAGERVRGVYDIIGTAWSSDDFKELRLSAQPLNPPAPAIELARSSLPVQGQKLASWSTMAIADETAVRLHLEGEDTQGNIASADVDVVIDNGPPAAPTGLTAVLSGVDVQTQWNPNTESDLLGYLLYRDNQLVNASGTLPADLRPFAINAAQYADVAVPDGQHRYVVYAIDRAGNVSPPSAPATLDPIDNKPPSMTIVEPLTNTRFESSVTVFATSRDSDIAEVRFSWRVQGNGAWKEFGQVFSAPPYRTVWTPPPGTAYGTYQIRAVARDAGGRYDPAPPSVNVVYADLTPPDAPINVVARGDGDGVNVTWSASGAADLKGYRVYRNGSRITSSLITGTTLYDSSRPDGDYTYVVTAVDVSGNESDDSEGSLAHVFGVNIEQPFSPTSAASVDLAGTSARAGTIMLYIDTDNDSTESASGSTTPSGAFALGAQTLALGNNHFTIEVTDADGNIGRDGEIWIDRGAVPATPTGVASTVDDHAVSLSWNANTEADLLGYRVFRNGHPVLADVALGESVTATGDGYGPARAVDGNLQTYWEADGVFGNPDSSPDDPSLELDWTTPRIVTVAKLSWTDESAATGNLDLYAWSGDTWIRVAHVRGEPQATQSITLEKPYRTTRMKLVVHGAGASQDYQYFDLAEIALLERPTQDATSLAETLIDGNYSYQISALSQFAFESPLSTATSVAVGDTQAPDAVVLDGTLAGTTASLGWSASASLDVARYDLLRDGSVIASIAAGDPRSYVDDNLSGGSHAYIVYAYDTVGNQSLPSNTVTLSVSGVGPAVPSLAITVPAEGASLALSWQAGAGAPPAWYALSRATSPDGPYEEIEEFDVSDPASYYDAPLVNGTTYYYTIEAFDELDNGSGPSSPVSGTPRDRTATTPLLTYPTIAQNPVTVHADTSEVCGAAEAGAAIQLTRDGTALAPLTATSAYAATPLSFSGAIDHVLAAPDGFHTALFDYHGGIQVVADGIAAESNDPDGGTRLQRWAAHGTTLYYARNDSDDLYRWELGRPAEKLVQPITSISAFASNPAETSLAISGDYAQDGGQTVNGVWLVDRTGTVRAIEGISPATLNTDAPFLSWSPDGTRLLLVGNGTADVIAVANATVVVSLSIDSNVRPSWARGSVQFAFARVNGQGNDDAIVFDVIAHTENVLRHGWSQIRALAWSPGDDRIAVLDEGQLDIVSALHGYSQLPVSYDNNAGWGNLVWTASGAIVADSDYEALRIVPDGWFCAASVVLAPGANHLDATATDMSGNRSLTSAAIEIDTPSDHLPDLAVSAADIFLLPPSGSVDQTYGALVSVRNLGTVDVQQPVLSATLTAPDGSTRPLAPFSPLTALAAGGVQSLSYAFGSLSMPGAYRLDIVADPQQLVREVDESNNAASAILTVSADGQPTLELNLGRSLFAPGEVVSGEVAVTNPGNAFTGHVQVDVLDASADVVVSLGDFPLTALAFGQRWSAPLNWDAQGVFAGDYHLRARLFAADESLLAEQSGPFTIGSVRHVQLAIAPDVPTQTIGGNVNVHSALDFSDGNALIDGATVRVSALDPGGNEVWHREQALGILLPGYVLDRDDLWATSGLGEGVYTLHLNVSAPGYAASTDATVTLTAAAPGIALNGSIAFDPGTTLIAGSGVTLNYRVLNQGSAELTGVQARLRIVAGAHQTPVSETDDQFDLGANSTHDASLVLTAPPLGLVAHAAILEARLPGDAPGQWRLLAQQGFAVVDLLPPQITVLSPSAGIVQPAVVPFRASIIDLHSAVADAQVSVDGGEWQPISPGLDGAYARGLTGLSDGDHVLSVRAHDTWGNLTQTAPATFSVDATPPVIAIAGVNDGDNLNHPVAPTVTITDAHLASSEVHLNGAIFDSGTSIEEDGSYVLTARATDTAGNQSMDSVRFVIDRVAPNVAITAPIDGAVVADSAIHVDVQTEALASVTLTTGSHQMVVTADNQGLAGFDGLPLTEGANRIEAVAADRAGNTSAPVAITVTYQTQMMQLTGSIGPLPVQIARGLMLDAPYDLHNGGTAALSALPVRVELHAAAGGDAVVVDNFVADVPAAGQVADTRHLATSGLAPGDYTAVLLAEPPDAMGAWVMLDSTSVHLYIDVCRSSGTDVIFADGFDAFAVQAPDSIFCNGFETELDRASASGTDVWSSVERLAVQAHAWVKRQRERHFMAHVPAPLRAPSAPTPSMLPPPSPVPHRRAVASERSLLDERIRNASEYRLDQLAVAMGDEAMRNNEFGGWR